jgi:hypothetical protein
VKLINKKVIILIVIDLLFTLYTYRSVLSGRLLGDPFDTRLQIILHEHWWRWINGQVSFRDTEFFYPFDKALGFSDVFLTQGLIYSLFRFFGFGLSQSWMATTFFLLFVGNLSWVFIGRKYIKIYFLQILLVLTAISSLSFVYYFSFNPNIVGYSFLPWFAMLVNSILNEPGKEKKYHKILLFITLLLVYSLSCWYGTFFLLLLLIFRIVLFIIFTPQNISFEINSIRSPKVLRSIVFHLPIQLFLIWVFSYVYISVANQPKRPIEELLQFSPRINLLPNGSNFDGTKLSGAVFKYLYTFLNLDFDKEYGIGIGLISLILSIFILLASLMKRQLTKSNKLWVASFIAIYLYFVIIFKNFSIHKFFFENVPGFNSIRFPGRYVILLGYFAIFGIYFIFDKVLQSSIHNWKRILIILASVILLLDQVRSPYKGWNSNLIINSDLKSQETQIKENCDYFYYDFPGGWWYDQIEAMMFAVQIGIPTVNGYSGAYPEGYPIEDFRSDKDPLEIFDWIGKIDSRKRGCLVTGRTKIQYLNRDVDSVDFVGFAKSTDQERRTNLLATSPNPYLYFYSNRNQNKKIFFTLKTSTCFQTQEIHVVDGQYNELVSKKIVSADSDFEFELNFENSIVKRIQIISNAYGCSISGTQEKIYFEIVDFQFKSI